MKKESSTNLQKYSGIAEQMIKMSSDCPEITKMILDIIYGDEGEGNGISTISQTALLYVCFTILPLWAAISLIGIKLAIPIAELVKYIIIAKKLIKDDKNINKKLLSIRLKIANKEK